MPGAIVRVCMVVAAAILNHPLLFPPKNSTLPEQDEDLIARMKEHEERLTREQAKLEKELLVLESKQQEDSSDGAYGSYFWSVLSLIVFFTIEVGRQDLAGTETWPIEDEDIYAGSGSITPRTMVLDKGLLSQFCDRCLYALAHDNWRVREFVEGVADDLLESMRTVCNREADMDLGDFLGVGSMFESWKFIKPLTCDLIVPFSPPAPYSFQHHLWCSPSSDIPPAMQGLGTIKVTKSVNEEGCLCDSANLGEDMLCLLHGKDGFRVAHSSIDLLCSRNTSCLAKAEVMKWFQISLTKAWRCLSHKYNFEISFRNLDAAGALKVRFRSGKVILMNIIPAVQLEDTDAYFVSHFPSDNSSPDPYWPLSFAIYEKNLLKHMTKKLPESTCHLHCLQILTFLHKKQTGISGESALTIYHLKTAVLHLLLRKEPADWDIGFTEERLRDVLVFLQRSLREKRLNHILVGNRQVPVELKVPEIFCKSEPINLFRPLVLQRTLYADTVRHFQEMLRNASVLIREYTPVFLNRVTLQMQDESF